MLRAYIKKRRRYAFFPYDAYVYCMYNSKSVNYRGSENEAGAEPPAYPQAVCRLLIVAH